MWHNFNTFRTLHSRVKVSSLWCTAWVHPQQLVITCWSTSVTLCFLIMTVWSIFHRLLSKYPASQFVKLQINTYKYTVHNYSPLLYTITVPTTLLEFCVTNTSRSSFRLHLLWWRLSSPKICAETKRFDTYMQKNCITWNSHRQNAYGGPCGQMVHEELWPTKYCRIKWCKYRHMAGQHIHSCSIQMLLTTFLSIR